MKSKMLPHMPEGLAIHYSLDDPEAYTALCGDAFGITPAINLDMYLESLSIGQSHD